MSSRIPVRRCSPPTTCSRPPAACSGPGAQLESLLQSSGVPAEHAPGLAALVLASCEGAVVIARAEHSLEPLDLIETILIAAAQATMPVAD
jgi:hypothetical protein